MGNILDEVVLFLEDNYVYVIGVGLIIILMLIGFLASRKKGRKVAKENEGMVNFNEVNTGSINDVANTIQSDVMQPIDIASFPQNETAVQPDAPQFEQAAPMAAPENVEQILTQSTVAPEPIVAPEHPVSPAVSEEAFFTPVTPVASEEPVNPFEQPVAPVASEEPINPFEQPVAPVASEEPNNPFEQPVAPVAPEEPNNPFEQPVAPVASEEPINPFEQPVAPVAPEEPINPFEQPVAPVASEEPTIAETPIVDPFINNNEPVVGPISEDIQAVNGDDLDKTEVIDLSPLNDEITTSNPEPETITPFTSGNLNQPVNDSLLNGDTGSNQ
jgi:FtsZ-interacting cell division protein ZipA